MSDSAFYFLMMIVMLFTGCLIGFTLIDFHTKHLIRKFRGEDLQEAHEKLITHNFEKAIQPKQRHLTNIPPNDWYGRN